MLRSSSLSSRVGLSNVVARMVGSNVRKRIDPDSKLRNDIKYLGKILGSAIKADDEKVYDAVERMRQLGREVGNILRGFTYIARCGIYSNIVVPFVASVATRRIGW